MTRLISWGICKRQFIRKVDIDIERANSIKNMALKRLERARRTEYPPDEISFLVEDYYEVVKELLVAYLLKNGKRSKNHQCLISYFIKEHPEYEYEANLISQMSFFRNRLGYYGEKVPESFYIKNKEDFNHVVKILLNLIK